jgi:hypothetical protein
MASTETIGAMFIMEQWESDEVLSESIRSTLPIQVRTWNAVMAIGPAKPQADYLTAFRKILLTDASFALNTLHQPPAHDLTKPLSLDSVVARREPRRLHEHTARQVPMSDVFTSVSLGSASLAREAKKGYLALADRALEHALHAKQALDSDESGDAGFFASLLTWRPYLVLVGCAEQDITEQLFATRQLPFDEMWTKLSKLSFDDFADQSVKALYPLGLVHHDMSKALKAYVTAHIASWQEEARAILASDDFQASLRAEANAPSAKAANG